MAGEPLGIAVSMVSTPCSRARFGLIEDVLADFEQHVSDPQMLRIGEILVPLRNYSAMYAGNRVQQNELCTISLSQVRRERYGLVRLFGSVGRRQYGSDQIGLPLIGSTIHQTPRT